MIYFREKKVTYRYPLQYDDIQSIKKFCEFIYNERNKENFCSEYDIKNIRFFINVINNQIVLVDKQTFDLNEKMYKYNLGNN